ISIVVFRFVQWNSIFNISIDIVPEKTLNITVIIIFTGILVQFFLKVITSILYAMQKSALNNFLNLSSNIIILVYVSFVTPTTLSNNIISLALVHVLAVNVPLLFTTFIVFSTKLKKCKPNLKFFKKSYAFDVIKLGGAFFWIQIMFMIITTTNEFLITWLVGTAEVVEYQIYNRLFLLVGTLFALALTPIWSTVTKALSEKNYNWIKKLFKILNLIALIAVVCEFAMIPFLQLGINIWLGENTIKVNYYYAVIFAISGSVFIWNGVLSSIANGLGELKTQSIFLTVGAFIKIPVAWFLVTIFDSWIGVIVANIVAMSLYSIIQPLRINKLLKNLRR
ncbi:lipopolysaccharide biosynthesis protein, partial [Rossellomorea marisflavi]|uniref:lipopolysaccharide biosynthesis protein n=1 Tax=Rossellomorea marisflavi TaxID=189381 RepID=UPI00064E3AE6